MNRNKSIGLITALSLFAGMISYPGSTAAAETPASYPVLGELHGGYLQLYTQEEITEESAESGTPLVQASYHPESYDLREEGYVTPVRDQGAEGMCFAFSAIGACESNLLMQALESDYELLDLSEAQMGHFLYTQQENPLDPLYGDYIEATDKGASGGNGIFAAAGLAVGLGTQLEQFCSYDDWGSGYSAYQRYGGDYRLNTMECITRVDDDNKRSVIKDWLMESGAVSIAFFSSIGQYYDNGTSYAYYAEGKSFYEDANHAGLIVGWDDNYSRENFDPDSRPDYDGAWLVKNSYGADLFDDGYFWLSYEDPTAGSFCRYILDPVTMYDDVYEYDGAGCVVAYDYDAAANVFVAENDCTLTHAAFNMPSGNGSNPTYEIRVYLLDENTDNPTTGKLVSRTTGKTSCSGYYTIPLDTSVSLTEGQQFSLVLYIENSNGSNGYLPIEQDIALTSGFAVHYHADPGESYVLSGNQWIDTTDLKEIMESQSSSNTEVEEFGNITLKALTMRTENNTSPRLEAALTLAEESGLDTPVLNAAIQRGRSILNSGAGALAFSSASATLLGALESEGGAAAFPEHLYDDFGIMAGDYDESNLIDPADATAALTVYAQRGASIIRRLTQKETYALDMNRNGVIEIDDASQILYTYAYMGAFGTMPPA